MKVLKVLIFISLKYFGMLYIEDSNKHLHILNPEDSFQEKYYLKYSNIIF